MNWQSTGLFLWVEKQGNFGHGRSVDAFSTPFVLLERRWQTHTPLPIPAAFFHLCNTGRLVQGPLVISTSCAVLPLCHKVLQPASLNMWDCCLIWVLKSLTFKKSLGPQDTNFWLGCGRCLCWTEGYSGVLNGWLNYCKWIHHTF